MEMKKTKIPVQWSKLVGQADFVNNALALLSLPFGEDFHEYYVKPPNIAGFHVNCNQQSEELNTAWSYVSEPVQNSYFL